MLRTQVSIDEKDYALAKNEAAALGISVAEYVRRAIRHALPTRAGPAVLDALCRTGRVGEPAVQPVD